MMEPTLYVVATPIGTLEDLSPRAREVLASVSFIACEDTRHSIGLLSHFGISVPLVSLHDHNEREKSASLVDRLKNSLPPTAAIITDAGTPCISDPGAHFVKAAREQGVRILSIPGPSALTTALSLCGFAQPRQLFAGFLPRKEGDRKREFEIWRHCSPCVAVFFESPNRVRGALQSLEAEFGDAVEVCVARELSKKFEEHLVGTAAGLLNVLSEREEMRGEYVICLNISEDSRVEQQKMTTEDACTEILALLHSPEGEGVHVKQLVKEVAARAGVPPKELYNLLQKKMNVEKAKV